MMMMMVGVDGHVRSWMKHPKVTTIGISNSANKSDNAMMIKQYEPWAYYQSVNLPLFESHVYGMFSD